MTAFEQQTERVTSVVEDYLKTIYMIQQEGQEVRTMLLAERMGVKPPTATAMIKALAELKLVMHTPYHGVELTKAGEEVALEVIRHHRLVELYLVEALGYSWDEVHEEAEALEHVISEKLEARIAARLGQPSTDPHGDPIPRLDGSVPHASGLALADLEIGARARVTRVTDQDVERLRYIAELGLTPGAEIELTARAPFDGPITVAVDDTAHALDHRLARTFLVER